MLEGCLRNSHLLGCLKEEQPIFRRRPSFYGQCSRFSFDILNFKDSGWYNSCAFHLGEDVQSQPLFLLFEGIIHLKPPLTVRKAGQNLRELL